MIKITYKQLSDFTTAQTLQKLSSTPTSNKNACHIHHILKEIQVIREKISADYQEKIVALYAVKDDKGEVVRKAGEPLSFDVDQTKTEAFMAAQEAFGDTEAMVNWKPLTMETIADVKISAAEINSLHGLFMEGPELPLGDNVHPIR